MSKKFQIILYVLGSIVLIISVLFAVGILNLEFMRFFKPRVENVNRKVFEETKSYVHGVIQDLGKYYDEYQKADENGKKMIINVIKFRFAEFDANNIKSVVMRNWFVEIRGY